MVPHRTSKVELKLVRNTGSAVQMPGRSQAQPCPRPDMLSLAREFQADAAGLKAVAQSIERAVDMIEAALSAAATVQDALREMRAVALHASEPERSAAERAALDESFRALGDKLPELIAAGEVNGMNLLKQGSPALEVLIDADTGESVRVQGEDFTPGGPNILLGSGDGVAETAHARMTAGLIGLSLVNVERAVARLALGGRKLAAHRNFVLRLSESLRRGIGSGVKPDAAADAARLRVLSEAQDAAGSTTPAGPASILLALFR